jgi:RecA/RadA recombinase
MAKSKTPESGSLNESVSKAIRGSFNLDNFIKSKNLSSTSIKMKEQRWIPLSPAFQNCLSIPGIPIGHITLLRGHSDTGKTTALLEAAVSAQKMGILPVFIITEMKWNWEHAKQMGLQFNEIADADGEVADYNGFFIYVDRERLNTIEDVAAFIADLLDEQKNGRLPYDLLFLWDSVGSIPSRLSIESNKNNNEWNAGAMSQQFGNFINQKIVLSRKMSQPYTNTMLAVNKIWVAKAENIMAQPKMANKGGNTMYFDSSLIVTFGNITNAGTNKIKATKNGKDVEFGKRTKIACDKNHVNDVTSVGKVIMTAKGFIDDTKQAIDKYKKENSQDWLKRLGSVDFDIVIEADEDSKDIFEPEPE